MNWILIAVVALVVFYFIYLYNNFVKLTQRVKEAWADIDVQLKRRYDLIPNLIETVKGYAAHERETLESVTQARTTATQTHIDAGGITPAQMAAMSGAEAQLSGALGKLIAIAENYPDLKANTNFAQLQSELADTENKIQAARRFLILRLKRSLQTLLERCSTSSVSHSLNFQKTVLNERWLK